MATDHLLARPPKPRRKCQYASFYRRGAAARPSIPVPACRGGDASKASGVESRQPAATGALSVSASFHCVGSMPPPGNRCRRRGRPPSYRSAGARPGVGSRSRSGTFFHCQTQAHVPEPEISVTAIVVLVAVGHLTFHRRGGSAAAKPAETVVPSASVIPAPCRRPGRSTVSRIAESTAGKQCAGSPGRGPVSRPAARLHRHGHFGGSPAAPAAGLSSSAFRRNSTLTAPANEASILRQRGMDQPGPAAWGDRPYQRTTIRWSGWSPRRLAASLAEGLTISVSR